MQLIKCILTFFFICTGALSASATKSHQKVVPHVKQLDKKVDKKGDNKKTPEKTSSSSKQNLSVLFGIVTAGIFILGIILFGFLYKSETGRTTTCAIIKPDAFNKKEQIKLDIRKEGFRIDASKEYEWTESLAQDFYKEHKERKFFNDLIEYMTSGEIVVLKLSLPCGRYAVQEFRHLAGPVDAAKAKVEASNSLRAKYGTNIEKNAIHASDSKESAEREIKLIFLEV